MHRQAVDSSAVVSVGYDPDTEELEIEFAGGDVYLYGEVPPEEFERVLTARSIGTYVNRRIKPVYLNARRIV